MISLFDDQLREIDQIIASIQPTEIPRLFRDIPLDIFGYLLLDVPPQFANIKRFFPSMASDAVQDNWTGAHGIPLLTQSSAFMKTLISRYVSITGKELETAVVLDYGCGWGRLIRLLYKFVSFERIYAVDPWDKSIELCQQHGIRGNIALSEYVPKSLPFERQFDLIYAFSVFTHLSQKTAHAALTTLRRYIAETGLLALTIRPKEYWNTTQASLAHKLIRTHEQEGFAFIPHNRNPIDGDITYGDTSISLNYFHSNFPQWKVISVDYNIIDSHQVILFLRPV